MKKFDMQIERECTAYEVEMGENNEWMFVEIILKTFFLSPTTNSLLFSLYNKYNQLIL